MAAAAAVTLSLLSPLTAHAEEIAQEAFTGASLGAGQWYSSADGAGDTSGWACLTAAEARKGPLGQCPDGKVDEPGRGALRLTSNKPDQSGFLLSEKAFPSAEGMRFKVDFASYDSEVAADGISLFLLDGAAKRPKKPGQMGGGLGYTGIEGGYLGVGLDEYGNFSNAGEGGRKPNSVTVRGASRIEGDGRPNPVVTGRQLKQPLAVPTAKKRADAKRTAYVDLLPTGMLSVAIDFHDGRGPVKVIDPVDLSGKIEGQPKVPETLRVGIAAGTGMRASTHDVWNASIETVEANVTSSLKPDGPLTPGADVGWTMTTANDKVAARTKGEVKVEHTFPKGVLPGEATGDGWTCRTKRQQVGCTYDAGGAKAIEPGRRFPPVTFTTKVEADAAGQGAVKSSVQAQGGHRAPAVEIPLTFAKGPKEVQEPQATKAPRLVADIRPATAYEDGSWAETLLKGGKGYVNAVLGNHDDVPVKGPISFVYDFPVGITPLRAGGSTENFWKDECTVAGQRVTCTTKRDVPANLTLGEVPIEVEVAKDAPDELAGTYTLTKGPDNRDVQRSKSAFKLKDLPPPPLSATLTPKDGWEGSTTEALKPGSNAMDVTVNNNTDALVNDRVSFWLKPREGARIKTVGGQAYWGSVCRIADSGWVICARQDDGIPARGSYKPMTVEVMVDEGVDEVVFDYYAYTGGNPDDSSDQPFSTVAVPVKR
ncbi:hypothetical protein ACFQVC_32425 [Streptomyces monticola]|uniref:Uncharacterized protein n=2 Tax=Streptomyces monticola TaxID=2666263 RepID=A0ABW2JU94_9ACTN